MSASDPVYKEIRDHCHAWPGFWLAAKGEYKIKRSVNRIHGDAGIHGFVLF
jgi:hypothetical protein